MVASTSSSSSSTTTAAATTLATALVIMSNVVFATAEETYAHARRGQTAATPSASPAAVALTVQRGSGTSLNLGMVVGLAVAAGIIVGAVVGCIVAYRFHLQRRREGRDHHELTTDDDFEPRGPRREAFTDAAPGTDDGSRAVWDGNAPLSSTRNAEGVVVEVDGRRGATSVKLTHTRR